MRVSPRTSIISANFQRLSKVLKQISPLRGDNAHFTKSFLKKSPSRCISSCQQDIKLDQFSQQNTHSRAAILLNSSLGGPSSAKIIFLESLIKVFTCIKIAWRRVGNMFVIVLNPISAWLFGCKWCSTGGGGGVFHPLHNSFVFKARLLKFCTELL